MINSTGCPQSMLVLGGSSDIGVATALHMANNGLQTVILAGRSTDDLERSAEQLRSAGVPSARAIKFDARETAAHAAVIDDAFSTGDIDVVLVAFGILGDQTRAEGDIEHAIDIVQTNFVGAVSSGLIAADRLRAQGHGVLVVLSSVAAERPRRANFVYGSSKAGLDAFAQGLGDALHGSGARVLVVRPGFVRSKMTAARPLGPFPTSPDAVAQAISHGLRIRAHTIWVPGQVRWFMSAIRHLPRPLFRRIKG